MVTNNVVYNSDPGRRKFTKKYHRITIDIISDHVMVTLSY